MRLSAAARAHPSPSPPASPTRLRTATGRRVSATVAGLALALLALACGGTGGDAGSSTGTEAPDAAATGTSFECAPDDAGLTLPDGFCAVLFAEFEDARPRHLVVDAEGDVYARLTVRRRRGQGEDDGPTGGLAALRDTDGDGRADTVERLDDTFGTGIALRDGFLYYATSTTVYRRPLAEGDLLPGEPVETMISGFPRQGQHSDKPFTFDGAGNIYVNVGAPSNACQQEARTPGSPGEDPCPQLERQAGIWRFDADRPGQTQEDDGERYATGIRNGLGIAWNPQVDALYATQHGRDSLFDLWNDLYTQEESAELPAEEFMRVDEGDDFGWPYCYWDHLQGERVLAPEYGGDGEEQGRCADKAEPLMAFPGHWGPNDLIFYGGEQFPERYRGGAFIAFHGSWNRMPFPQEGYSVVFVPLDDRGMPAGDYEVFATGFKGAEEIATSRDAEYRPTGLAVGPDGSLYIADDRGGRIWRVVHAGS